MSDAETENTLSSESNVNSGADLSTASVPEIELNTSDSGNQTESPSVIGHEQPESSSSEPSLSSIHSNTVATDFNANEQPGPSSASSNPASGSEPRETSNFPALRSRLELLMADAMNTTNGPTVESLESLRSIVDRFERTFGQFKQETETAIADCRREFNEIRRKFETLKRIRQSLVIEFVERRVERPNRDSDEPPEPKRKRWGKKTSVHRRRRD